MTPTVSTASPIYPGHELLIDDPSGVVVRSHGPSIPGTNAQRLAYPTSLLSVGKQWYETDTGYTYQWSGSAWGFILGGSVTPSGAAGGSLSGTYPNPLIGTNVVTNSNLAQAPAYTLKGNNTASPANVADLTLAQISSMLAIPNVQLCGLSLANGISCTATISGGVCTVTVSNNYTAGDVVVMTGTATTGTFAGLYVLTGATGSNFTFNTSASGTVTAPVITYWFKGTLALNPTKISNISANTQNIIYTFTNTQTASAYGMNTLGSATTATGSAGPNGTFSSMTTSCTVYYSAGVPNAYLMIQFYGLQ